MSKANLSLKVQQLNQSFAMESYKIASGTLNPSDKDMLIQLSHACGLNTKLFKRMSKDQLIDLLTSRLIHIHCLNEEIQEHMDKEETD